MPGPILIQLPLNTGAPVEPTGNVPLAGAILSSAAGLPVDSVLPSEKTDILGDRAIVDEILSGDPSAAGFTLYSWNAERSLYIAGKLRERLPDLLTVAGGPEVFRDNNWLIGDDRISLFVSGEGESMAERVLAGEIDIPADRFISTGSCSTPPGKWPNPYLSGHLDPRSGDSVYLETIRGCSSSCIFCSYRRISPVPRRMGYEEALMLLGELKKQGAADIVFLDPTFNGRDDLLPLLDGMSSLGLACFGEMRGELIDGEIALRIRRAGFTAVEIGIQSLTGELSGSIGRNGDPLLAMEGALHLRDAGVEPVLDLILGLPGETPAQSIAGASALKAAGLHSSLQVFILSLLPGTEIRARAAEYGISFMDRPPYYVLSLPDISSSDLLSVREAMADVVGFDLDLQTRPLLFDDWPGTEIFDLIHSQELPEPPSYRHGSLVLSSDDFWMHRDELIRHVMRRRNADPFCVLDLVLRPKREFPLDVIDMIGDLDVPVDHAGRAAEFLGRQGNLRVSVLLEDYAGFDQNWLGELSSICRVVIDVCEPDDLPEELWNRNISIRLPGEWDVAILSGRVPFTDQVFFKSIEMETIWSRDILGLS